MDKNVSKYSENKQIWGTKFPEIRKFPENSYECNSYYLPLPITYRWRKHVYKCRCFPRQPAWMIQNLLTIPTNTSIADVSFFSVYSLILTTSCSLSSAFLTATCSGTDCFMADCSTADCLMSDCLTVGSLTEGCWTIGCWMSAGTSCLTLWVGWLYSLVGCIVTAFDEVVETEGLSVPVIVWFCCLETLKLFNPDNKSCGYGGKINTKRWKGENVFSYYGHNIKALLENPFPLNHLT